VCKIAEKQNRTRPRKAMVTAPAAEDTAEKGWVIVFLKNHCVIVLNAEIRREERGKKEAMGIFVFSHVFGFNKGKNVIHVWFADVASLIPSHRVTNRRHIANHYPCQQTNIIRTNSKFQMINICNDKMEKLGISGTWRNTIRASGTQLV